MMTVDPDARITIPEIQAHPWFLRDLPAGVLDMNNKTYPSRCTQTREEVDAILARAMAPAPRGGGGGGAAPMT